MKPLHIILIIALVATLPWLGLTDFNTKGEPREAIVSVSMLQSGNWILPTNNGGEMAYKPPFMHWCIAALSLPLGHVSEYTSRLPSALALIVLTVWTFLFFSRTASTSAEERRRREREGLLTALVFLTSFEVFRAGFACRVDMVLTLGIVGAIYAFFERRWLLAVLMMSLGTLTKGPVAIVLPCGVMGVYTMVARWKERDWWADWCRVVLCSLLALVLPLTWYYLAWQQGGDEFFRLVKEENVDRFLGKMSYASHENPVWYYMWLLPVSFVPWTLVALAAYKPLRLTLCRLRQHERLLYAVVSFLLVFVFYCIPKSKRGVYILPVYPFLSYGVALWIMRRWSWLTCRRIAGVVVTLWIIAYGAVLPFVLNPKSDLPTAREVKRLTGEAPLTSYVAEPMMHFFTINYYLGDRVGVWDGSLSEGFLLIGERDAEAFIPAHSAFRWTPVALTPHKSCDVKQHIQLYKFQRQQ